MEGRIESGDRFELRARLGAGGMGVVYRALDRERGAEVALKVLRAVEPASLERFKREFRALANIVHANLVQLHELFCTGDQWFFTMELIEGKHVFSHIRGDTTPPRDEREQPVTGTVDLVTAPSRHSTSGRQPLVAPPLSDAEAQSRLRDTLIQLVHGVQAVHEAGHLHRDIKPSNLLVTHVGRAKLLDFGVVAALGATGSVQTTRGLVGTPLYMAPEQARGGRLTPACDWYAVGTFLYQALTGRPTYSCQREDLLARKIAHDPPPVHEIWADAPADLADLCEALLAREPAARPDGTTILARLGAAPVRPTRRPEVARSTGLLMGRERELAELRTSYEAVIDGGRATVLIHGSSGMGKSALLQRFLADLHDQEALVLQGRCFERESVPYKAVDAIIDAIARHLAALPHDDALALMPPHMKALARVFPMLNRVESVLGAASIDSLPPDPRVLRGRAVGALRALLCSLATRQPLVVAIDDLQWGDSDSAELLSDLLRPPESPKILFIGCYRDEDVDISPFLTGFLPTLGDPVRIPVARLPLPRAAELAERLLGDDASGFAETVARESQGSPLFVAELARWVLQRARGGTDTRDLDAVSLEQVLRERFDALDEAPRRLLEIISVAGRPISQAVAMRCARVPPDDLSPIGLLRSDRLIRTHGARDSDLVEAFHDRIRESAAALLTRENLRACHARLAEVLASSGSADAESLAIHLHGAGDRQAAAWHYAQAAEQAGRALAFERAAALYALSLELDPLTGADASAMRARLAEALAEAGRGRDAAEAYHAAAPDAPTALALEYRGRAAHQLLVAGHIEDGAAALRDVLDAVELGTPATPKRALALLLWRRLRLKLRGLGYKRRETTELSAKELARMDACWSGAIGFGMVDTIYGAEFHSRHLLMALSAGEPKRIAKALSLEAGHASALGNKNATRARRLAADAIALAESLNEDEARAWAWGSAAFVECMLGNWRDGREKSERALAIMRERVGGLSWERATVKNYYLASLYYCGAVDQLVELVPEFLRDAYARGDLYTATNTATGRPNLAWLVRDRPDKAQREMARAMASWCPDGFLVQHHWETLARCHIDLYRGDTDSALALISERGPLLEKSLLLRVQLVRLEWAGLRARCYLAAGELEPAAHWAKRLAKERVGWGNVFAGIVRAGVAHGRGDAQSAGRELRAAEEAATERGLELLAAVARRRRGLLENDTQLADAAEDWMRTRRIVRPDRLSYVFAPF